MSFADNGGVVSVALNGAGLAALNFARGGPVALGGALTSIAGSGDQRVFGSTGLATDVRELVLTLGSPEDWYAIDVTSADAALRLETATPADGIGQFVNLLNPRIELYDPSGALVAAGAPLADGRNEFLEHQLLVAGTYRVRVVGEGGTWGEYFLGVKKVPTFTLAIDDPATAGVDVIIVDDAPAGTPTPLGGSTHADGHAGRGVILSQTPVGRHPLVVVTAISKPVLAGQLLLSVVALSGAGGGALDVWATDTGFQGAAGANAVAGSIAGVTQARVTFHEFVDTGDRRFPPADGSVHALALGPFCGGPFAGAGMIPFNLAGPGTYSLTKHAHIESDGAFQLSSFGANGVVVTGLPAARPSDPSPARPAAARTPARQMDDDALLAGAIGAWLAGGADLPAGADDDAPRRAARDGDEAALYAHMADWGRPPALGLELLQEGGPTLHAEEDEESGLDGLFAACAFLLDDEGDEPGDRAFGA
jgi:hypothetical protein